jgi:hypothetical protein
MEGIKVGIAGLVAALAVSGCYAQTDAESYYAGDVGTVTFTNDSPITAYLGGCNAFDQEQLEGDTWVSRGGDVMCIWEGIAQPVSRQSDLELPFEARSSGTWRLHFDVGLVCEEDEPLSQADCGALFDVYSNEFTVEQRTCELGYFADCSPGDACIRTQGDCCGCANGGTEVAINAEYELEWLIQMQCPPGVNCIALYLCTDRVPRCVSGCCELVDP